MNMEEIVALSVKHNVSDLHLCNAWPARWRIRGNVEIAPFTTPDVETLLMCWLSEQQQVQWQKQGQLDFAITLTNSRRLRASAFVHQQGISLALRLLPLDCPCLDDLQTPAALPELLQSENGLILVTGATGSGKSATLAAMVSYLNQHVAGHILTLEDPIEYRYTSQRCLIQQREVGVHCASFAAGLRGALREDPDVILLGELRDVETIRLALTAAETGHLVLATLHTRGAAQAIARLVDTFPAPEKDPVRNQLADSLRAVLSQKLEQDKQGGRVALFELLINTPAVGNLIREGKTHQLPGIMQTGQQTGMQTFTQSLQQRQAQGRL
ncbi:Type II secretory pathway, ATPase PulE/Tfp pilus assembly pathway, ATPase PilB [Citrobacter werkmanii]|uniref:Type II secretory pathway, ATPase PulE/Tfp pilus assembly pathway, ATPase PilB n=1 Tax=Citrobacter werkmanii TaxID=67827 RepID=A0A9N8GSN6_9ENTR|nr:MULTISPECIES: type IV pilus twitching motility protein PilT [Citrobacter]CAB5518992.1 Type II secretory pathway, ATPase PulE/Tfp pilus assembly pathway, ATPase PilB [Citrobacter werkmanii]CAB5523147.1 Type II secretory pathway, ATPase PulE/Tfp pilus assembly pathway, ATPase PilB [Citrobacter werkmanii]CAB5526380.1 Type II secretory pathway, ATPase PulE/Tfp pilus assembly pathway, ATPase PilB [Citrobacter werkmanii]CAB5532559.1 Type II secretory pathway, ATPase PulE/Tfp pilus assembly pathway